MPTQLWGPCTLRWMTNSPLCAWPLESPTSCLCHGNLGSVRVASGFPVFSRTVCEWCRHCCCKGKQTILPQMHELWKWTSRTRTGSSRQPLPPCHMMKGETECKSGCFLQTSRLKPDLSPQETLFWNKLHMFSLCGEEENQPEKTTLGQRKMKIWISIPCLFLALHGHLCAWHTHSPHWLKPTRV